MKEIEKFICSEVFKFISDHISEVEEKRDIFGHPQRYKDLGFKDREDMLNQIHTNPEIAVWALQELMSWGMSKDHSEKSFNYTRELFTEEGSPEDGNIVYKLGNPCRYFIVDEFDKIIEVHKTTKLVEVVEWQRV